MKKICKSSLLQGAVFSFPRNISRKEYTAYYELWVKPYLSLAYNHPTIPFFFYISGIVFEGFEKSYKECMVVLQELISRGQVELLGGLYYDTAPLLQASKDQREQIEKLSYYIKKHYKVLHKGVWITPGTFDNTSIPLFKKTGTHYLFVQRAYVELVHQQSRMGLIEEKGEMLPLFIYDKVFMQKIQSEHTCHKDLEKMTEDLKNSLGSVYIALAEYHDIFNTKMYFKSLETFQTMLESSNVISSCRLPSDERKFCKEQFTFCRVRTTAYGDEENETFVKQIVYRSESRLLYGMLQHCAQKVAKYKKDKTRKQSAKLMLMEAQNHFPFWSFNTPWGIQDMAMRQGLYKLFISILKTLQELDTTKNKRGMLSNIDINLDGKKELIFSSSSFMGAIETEHGSLCLLHRIGRSKSWNYGACYSPWYNAQHPPWSFRETIVPRETSLETLHMDMLENKYSYHPIVFSKVTSKNTEATVYFSAEHERNTYNASETDSQENASYMAITKDYKFQNTGVVIHYNIANVSEVAQQGFFIIEIKLAFSQDNADVLSITTSDNKIVSASHTHIKSTQGMRFHHIVQKEYLTFDFSTRADVHIASVYGGEYTSVQSVYQYTDMLVQFPLDNFAVQNDKNFSITLGFSSIK